MISIVRKVMSMAGLGRYSRYLMLLALIAVPLIAAFSLGGGSLKDKWVIMLVTFVSLLVIGGIFFLILKIWKKKKGNELSSALQKDAGSMSMAGIESMRSNFQTGVEKLNKAGKNVYDLPWFLLAGQAGSGKTEAIRRSHSKEDFPPGLNDLMQGVGGTLNMNWWFTNESIILDTAGRVFEEKVEVGKNNEWQEFLKMLKKVRKNTPINGFLLAIPADSLIRDKITDIESKASHIAEQITLVQNLLGVRFPVFILVTKSDFIPGFREFVENITEPNLQQQMLGWSNPNGLDEPFEPNHIDEYLDGVISKLKKRRLTYLLDPRAEDGKKRLDDLDSLFAFPEELRAAVPNLRRYIEIVFSLNPWSQKPLFIRGIYFTSSLQQGDALDKAIAEVLGKNLGDLALTSFKKETPLFLRDSFFQKIYREKGLVTSASDVKGEMRKRTVKFALSCIVGMSIVVAAAFWGANSFRKSVGNEYVHWKFAGSEYNESVEFEGEYEWARPIIYDTGIDDTFESEKEVTFEVANQVYTLPTYFEKMAALADSKLKVPLIFRPLKFFDDVFTGNRLDRKEALRHLYEDAIILPILDNSRKKMAGVTKETWNESYADGLSALIKFHMLFNQPKRKSGYTEAFFEQLNKLYYFLAGETLGTQLEAVYDDFFTDSYAQDTGWPNEEYSRRYAIINTLKDERLSAIANGLRVWIHEVGNIRDKQEADIKQLSGVLNTLDGVGRVEDQFIKQVTASSLSNMLAIDGLSKEYASFIDSVENLITGEQNFTFMGYYNNQINRSKTSVEEWVDDLIQGPIAKRKIGGMLSKAVAGKLSEAKEGIETVELPIEDSDLPKDLDVDESPTFSEEDVLSFEILKLIDAEREELVESFERVATPELLDRFRQADQNFLEEKYGLESRIKFYRELSLYVQELNKLKLEDWSQGASVLRKLEKQYETVFAPAKIIVEQSQISIDRLNEIADRRMEKVRDRLFKDYQRLVLGELKKVVGFPVLADANRIMSVEEIEGLEEVLYKVLENVNVFETEMGQKRAADFELMRESIMKISEFASTYLTAEMARELVTVSLPPLSEIGSENLSDTIIWRARFVQVDSVGKRQRIGEESRELGEVELGEDRMIVFFTSTIDGTSGDVRRLTLSGGWAPLQLLLRDYKKVTSVGRNKYIYRDKVNIPSYKQVTYALFLQLPKPLPDIEEWPRIFDLKGF